MTRPLPIAAALFALACADKTGTDSAVTDTSVGQTDSGGSTWTDEGMCAEAADRLGYAACAHGITTDALFEDLTLASSSVDQLRVGKYLVPAVDDARLPPVFIDVDAFSLHLDFMVTAFPDIFSGMSTGEYEQLTLQPDTREFYAGTYSLYLEGSGFFYGFTVWDDTGDDDATLTQDQATAAWTALQERFEIGELAFVPNGNAQLAAAATWTDTPFTIKGLDDTVTYEVYNPGEAYGTLRLYTLDELETATEEVAFGYQDIVVIEEAPGDLERVVSGIVTGTRQGDLSHLNVRSLARGTPNCFVSEPLEELAEWADTLVRIECGEDAFSIDSADQADAEAWWESIRPDPVEVCEPDLDHQTLSPLLELPTDSAEDRATALCQYGSKGTNLATLYQRIDAAHAFTGFLIPLHYYDQFVNDNSWTVDLGDGEATHTFAETIAAWHADETFLTDPTERRARLESLRSAILQGDVDDQLVADLGDAIVETWGDDETMVRFRSSSNAEDSLEFGGAGLYESESVCLADELDADGSGPSLCDSDKDNEKTVRDGLREVWASLWNMQAWDERDWYGIDHTKVAMGVLVNDRSKDEQANAVAFTGNPTSDGDDRYLINAQEGELEVVSSDPGVWPEKILVTVEDGSVSEIYRVSESSETSEVLSDADVTDLSDVLTVCAEAFPNDHDVPEGRTLLWDTEWKITSDGRLVIKQIRPYLR